MLGYNLFLLFLLSNLKVLEVNGWSKSDSPNKNQHMLNTFRRIIYEESEQHFRPKRDVQSDIKDLEKKLEETNDEIEGRQNTLKNLQTLEDTTKDKISDLQKDAVTNGAKIKNEEQNLIGIRKSIELEKQNIDKAKKRKKDLEKQIEEKKKPLNPASPDPSTSTAKSPPRQPDDPGKPNGPKDEKPDDPGKPTGPKNEKPGQKKPTTTKEVPSTTPTPTTLWTKLLQHKMHCFSRLMKTFEALSRAMSRKLQGDVKFFRMLLGSKM